MQTQMPASHQQNLCHSRPKVSELTNTENIRRSRRTHIQTTGVTWYSSNLENTECSLNGLTKIPLQVSPRKQAMPSAVGRWLSPLLRTEAVVWWGGVSLKGWHVCSPAAMCRECSSSCFLKHWGNYASWILQCGDWHHLNTGMIDEISCQLESWVGNAGDRGRIPGFHLCLAQCVIFNSKSKSKQGMLWSVKEGSYGINECLSKLV